MATFSEEKLAPRSGAARAGEPGWMQGFGKLRHLQKETARIQERIREAFAGGARGSGMILDTNALSAFVDGDAGVGDALRTQVRAAIPVIVLGEFRYGIGQSKRRSSYEAWLDANLIHFDILSVTQETAIAYAALRMTLKRSGCPIPASDAWIAALALQHRLPVLSRDAHFDVVPDLNRRSW
jgi:tRNA(fMet)-specific endonuclease VapC